MTDDSQKNDAVAEAESIINKTIEKAIYRHISMGGGREHLRKAQEAEKAGDLDAKRFHEAELQAKIDAAIETAKHDPKGLLYIIEEVMPIVDRTKDRKLD